MEPLTEHPDDVIDLTTPRPSSDESEGGGSQPDPRHAPQDREEEHEPTGHEGSFVRRNGLALACFGLFFLFWACQAVTGWHVFNQEAETHGQEVVGFGQYLLTGHFVEATLENWESEFLQMAAFIMLTAWLVQRGSAESKQDEGDDRDDPAEHRLDPDAPWPVRRGGWVLRLYENSLVVAFALLFLASIVGHAVGGLAGYNEEQISHGDEPVTLVEFASSSDFWFQSFQNWQSEFLAVGSIVVLSIFLRQKRSPESKPVYAANWRTHA